MPTILDLFKQANGNKDITTWNGGHKDKGLIGGALDFVKAELNPQGPRILFYKKLVTPPLLYGTETPRISLKGTVDPGRSESLKTARYNEDPLKKVPLLDLGSLLGGSANRPSDTIFEGTDTAPVTRYSLPSSVGDHTAEQYAVEGGPKKYYISKTPIGPNALKGVMRGDMNQMATKIIGAGIGAAKKAVGKAVTKLVTKKRKKNQKGQPEKGNPNLVGKLYNDEKKNSQWFTTYDGKFPTNIKERKKDEYISIDEFNYKLLTNNDFATEDDFDKAISTPNSKLGQSYIKIKPYGKQYVLVFPATISGITEDVAPEWTPFKYIGSPYNVYRYQGVERSLQFDFKLYYIDNATKSRMIANLNSLKELVFPYNEISHIKYNDTDVALAYSPNLIEITIGNLYKNILGVIDSLSFTIEDDISWASGDVNMEGSDTAYPTVINVSFAMKIIERHTVDESILNTGTRIMKYDFDGTNQQTISYRTDLKLGLDKLTKETDEMVAQGQRENTYNDSIEVIT